MTLPARRRRRPPGSRPVAARCRWGWLAVAGAALAVACTDTGQTSLRGRLTVACADAAVPLLQREVQVFQALYTGARIDLVSTDSRGALVELFDRQAGVAVISRGLTEDEKLAAAEGDVGLETPRIAIDGVAFIVHPRNRIDSLTVAQAAALWSGSAVSWRALGGDNVPVRLVLRSRNSGTYETVRQQVLGGSEFGQGLACGTSAEVVARVAADPAAVGCVGLAWLGPSVKALRLAATTAGPFVPATAAEVYMDRYPIRRSLVACHRRANQQAPLAAGFVAFLTSTKGQIVVEREGLVPDTVPERTIQLTRTGLPQEAP